LTQSTIGLTFLPFFQRLSFRFFFFFHLQTKAANRLLSSSRTPPSLWEEFRTRPICVSGCDNCPGPALSCPWFQVEPVFCLGESAFLTSRTFGSLESGPFSLLSVLVQRPLWSRFRTLPPSLQSRSKWFTWPLSNSLSL